MNKIVRRHYPVERLPEDLRQELPDVREVTVTIESVESEQNVEPMTFEEIFAARKPPFRSADEIMAEIYEGRYGG
jgi:hypothetical protein